MQKSGGGGAQGKLCSFSALKRFEHKKVYSIMWGEI